MTERLFIVFGESGSYSDWSQWPVAAYRDEMMARQHVENAEVALRLRYELKTKAATDILDEWDRTQKDSVSRADVYSLQEVELRDALPDAPLEQMRAGLDRAQRSRGVS